MKRWLGGVLLGSGVFQLYDGTIQHKVMKVHQIRYVENVWVYDIIWNLIAIFLIILGMILIERSRREQKNAEVGRNERL